MAGGAASGAGRHVQRQISDWNIRVRETSSWEFTPANTQVLSAAGLASDGQSLTVSPLDADMQPGSFIIAAGRIDLGGMMLADFTSDASGQAGLMTASVLQWTSGLPLDANGNVLVARVDASGAGSPAMVPEPSMAAMLLGGLVGVAALARRQRQTSPCLLASTAASARLETLSFL